MIDSLVSGLACTRTQVGITRKCVCQSWDWWLLIGKLAPFVIVGSSARVITVLKEHRIPMRLN